jgi:hypothetical protein
VQISMTMPVMESDPDAQVPRALDVAAVFVVN